MSSNKESQKVAAEKVAAEKVEGAKVVNKSENKLSFRVINKVKNVLKFRQVTIEVGKEHILTEAEQKDERLMAKINRASDLNMVDLVK